MPYQSQIAPPPGLPIPTSYFNQSGLLGSNQQNGLEPMGQAQLQIGQSNALSPQGAMLPYQNSDTTPRRQPTTTTYGENSFHRGTFQHRNLQGHWPSRRSVSSGLQQSPPRTRTYHPIQAPPARIPAPTLGSICRIKTDTDLIPSGSIEYRQIIDFAITGFPSQAMDHIVKPATPMVIPTQADVIYTLDLNNPSGTYLIRKHTYYYITRDEAGDWTVKHFKDPHICDLPPAQDSSVTCQYMTSIKAWRYVWENAKRVVIVTTIDPSVPGLGWQDRATKAVLPDPFSPQSSPDRAPIAPGLQYALDQAEAKRELGRLASSWRSMVLPEMSEPASASASCETTWSYILTPPPDDEDEQNETSQAETTDQGSSTEPGQCL